VSDDGAFPAALSGAAGLDLAAYRAEHVAERVHRACKREGADDAAALARLLRRDEDARSRFRRSVAVPVSGYFRDPAQFDLLETELLPPLLERQGRIRVWSAGCADGSELVSIATVLDRLGVLARSFVLGSDLLDENVVAARRAVEEADRADFPLRRHVRVEQADLMQAPPPGGRFALVLCRNVAIYFAAEAKQGLHATLAAALAPGGVLLLGRSERIAAPAALGLVRVAAHAYRRAEQEG
jgi:chemotaxis protein methyltransferase CheR